MIEPTIEKQNPTFSGTQKIYRFENGYGASVIRLSAGTFRGSYGAEQGLWELAVIKFKSEDVDDFKLVYDTPITAYVIGHLTLEEVDEILERIKVLKNGKI